jgi:DNA replication protein DnaC
MASNRNIPPTALDELRRDLGRLKLMAMAENLDKAVEQASTLEQGYIAFLAGLVSHELLARTSSAMTRRQRAARLPCVRTFDTFDWNFQTGLNVRLVKDLQSLHFIDQGRPVLFLGRPGTGKSHMSIALAMLAVCRGYSVRFYKAAELLAELYASLADATTDKLIGRLARVDLLIIDDVRMVPPRPEYATLMFDLIEARHLRKATVVSSNLSVKQWGRVLGDPVLTASMVDRLLEGAHVVNIKKGRSYRTEGPGASEDRPDEMEGELFDEDST